MLQYLRYVLSSRHRRRCLLIAFVLTTATALAQYPVVRSAVPATSLLLTLEMKLLDWRFRERGRRRPPVDIIIAAVDEDSIRKFGRWPWRRERMAAVIRKLAAAGARAIVFDIFFVEPDLDDPASDRQLVEATREAGNVFHAWFSVQGQEGAVPLPADQLAALRERAWPLQVREHPGDHLPAYTQVTPPLPGLTRAAEDVGYAELHDTGDGVFRTYDLAATYAGGYYPSLALAVAAHDLEVDPHDVVITPGREMALGDQASLALVQDAAMLLDFYGPDGTIPRVSVRDVLEGRIRPQEVSGRIVVIGVTAKGAYELRPSPFGAVFYGVEMQATAIANLLDNRAMPTTSFATDLLITVGFGILIGLTLTLWRPAPGAVVSLMVFVGYNLLCVALFTRANVVMPMAAPNVALVACALAILVYRLSTEERHRNQITRTFGLFVPPQVVTQLTGEDARVARLEAERREITILFSDIRDFTAYSERTEAEDVVALLNRYFSLMHEVVWEFGGTLDKYMGDGLMAFFGAPTYQEDHSERAVLAAVQMQRVIRSHADEWASFGMEGLRVGMGLHVGEVLVGLTGSEGRMQYTCMGDAVNLASRLEESTRDLNADVIISGDLYERVAEAIDAEPIGRLKIRGISAEVMAYAVTGPAGSKAGT